MMSLQRTYFLRNISSSAPAGLSDRMRPVAFETKLPGIIDIIGKMSYANFI